MYMLASMLAYVLRPGPVGSNRASALQLYLFTFMRFPFLYLPYTNSSNLFVIVKGSAFSPEWKQNSLESTSLLDVHRFLSALKMQMHYIPAMTRIASLETMRNADGTLMSLNSSHFASISYNLQCVWLTYCIWFINIEFHVSVLYISGVTISVLYILNL